MLSQNRYVVSHPDGWAVMSGYRRRAISVHNTQVDAIMAARWAVMRNGGGEVRVQEEDGRWIVSDTIASGDDPFPS